MGDWLYLSIIPADAEPATVFTLPLTGIQTAADTTFHGAQNIAVIFNYKPRNREDMLGNGSVQTTEAFEH